MLRLFKSESSLSQDSVVLTAVLATGAALLGATATYLFFGGDKDKKPAAESVSDTDF